MLATIAGQCGVVTDATSGVGRAVTLELARDCARVAIGYPGFRGADLEAAERIAHEVVGLGGEAIPLRIPAGNLSELERVIADLVDHWGRLDYVVDLDSRCMFGRAALPWMLERTYGRIIHISPLTARRIGFTRQDVIELTKRGITLNCITTNDSTETGPPGGVPRPAQDGVETPAHLRRSATPEDVAATTYFLLAQATHMTGQIIDLSVGSAGGSVQHARSTLGHVRASAPCVKAAWRGGGHVSPR
jgi:3-oxoacyl-[acyl-carrier protein] reductase